MELGVVRLGWNSELGIWEVVRGRRCCVRGQQPTHDRDAEELEIWMSGTGQVWLGVRDWPWGPVKGLGPNEHFTALLALFRINPLALV